MLNTSAVVLGWRQLLQLPPRGHNTRHMLALPKSVLYTYLRRSTICYHRLRTHPASIHLANRSQTSGPTSQPRCSPHNCNTLAAQRSTKQPQQRLPAKVVLYNTGTSENTPANPTPVHIIIEYKHTPTPAQKPCRQQA